MGLETAFPAIKRLQTYALDRTPTWMGKVNSVAWLKYANILMENNRHIRHRVSWKEPYLGLAAADLGGNLIGHVAHRCANHQRGSPDDHQIHSR